VQLSLNLPQMAIVNSPCTEQADLFCNAPSERADLTLIILEGRFRITLVFIARLWHRIGSFIEADALLGHDNGGYLDGG